MGISNYLKTIREKVGHDLVALTAVSISIFDNRGHILLGKDVEMGCWTLPGGAIDPHEQPADAAVRECFEETGLLVKPDQLIGVFGGPEFLVRYPNADLAYYTTIAFSALIVGGSHKPQDGEMSELRYFSKSQCASLAISRSSKVIAEQAFVRSNHSHFRSAVWTPPTAARQD